MKPDIITCPSTLARGFSDYSSLALKKLYSGSRVSCLSGLNSPASEEGVRDEYIENRKQLSISGAQVKHSITQRRNKLTLTLKGEQGTHILKPVPWGAEFSFPEELPANENLTMQIASQAYSINTAANGIIFFNNFEPAYITKRFDVNPGGGKISQEDLTVLMGMTEETNGKTYKYEGSYQKAADVLKKFIPAYKAEAEKFFSLVVFNYLFSNGDAHLRNFSVQQIPSGDHILAPTYDLVNTRIHIKDDSAMALKEGLFDGDYYTESFERNGFYAYDDFYEFGLKIGLVEKRMINMLNKFRVENQLVYELINNSYLSQKLKTRYIELYEDRLKALNYSFKKRI